MNRPVSDIMQKSVIVAHVEDTISEIEQFLAQNQLSFLPIVDDDGHCFGVISEKDLLKFHKDMGNSSVEHAWEVCSHAVIEISPSTEVSMAAGLLITENIHHLVVTSDQHIEGIVSATDLLRFFMSKSQANKDQLSLTS